MLKSVSGRVQTLNRYEKGQPLNLSDVARWVRMSPERLSLKDLLTRIESFPNSVNFQKKVVTGVELGGEVNIILNRDGSHRFSGFMRATGWRSFSFRLNALVLDGDRQVMVTASHSGRVYGTDTPGKRQHEWDELTSSSSTAEAIRQRWPAVSAGTMDVTRGTEVIGVTGTLADVVMGIAKIFYLGPVVGTQAAVCIVIGSELDRAGADLPGLGGVIGLTVVAGSVVLFGPGSAMQAAVVGVALGAVVDAMITVRRLEPPEVELAKQVFGDNLDYDRIRVTNLVGLGNRAFAFPALGGKTLLNLGNAPDSGRFDQAISPNYPVPGQLLIHELAHAWQYEHMGDQAIAQLCQGIREQTVHGQAAYGYGPAGQPWSSFTMEGQASIVSDWFGGTNQNRSANYALVAAMDPHSPYYPYIHDVIL